MVELSQVDTFRSYWKLHRTEREIQSLHDWQCSLNQAIAWLEEGRVGDIAYAVYRHELLTSREDTCEQCYCECCRRARGEPHWVTWVQGLLSGGDSIVEYRVAMPRGDYERE